MQSGSPDGKHFVIIDDSFDAFWAYLMDQNQKIISDCWAANKPGIPQREIGYYRIRNTPPPAKEEVIEKNIEITPDDVFLFKWNDKLEEVVININGTDYIKFNYGLNRGFHKLLKKNCPWGSRWE